MTDSDLIEKCAILSELEKLKCPIVKFETYKPQKKVGDDVRRQSEYKCPPENLPLLSRSAPTVLRIDTFPDDPRNKDDHELKEE